MEYINNWKKLLQVPQDTKYNTESIRFFSFFFFFLINGTTQHSITKKKKQKKTDKVHNKNNEKKKFTLKSIKIQSGVKSLKSHKFEFLCDFSEKINH